MTAVAELTERQRALHGAVVSRSSATAEQMILITTLARTVGASERDVRTVRDVLLAGHIRECRS